MVYDNENEIESILRYIGEGCSYIADEFRNESAHTGRVGIEKAQQCFDYIVKTTKFLIKTLIKFKY